MTGTPSTAGTPATARTPATVPATAGMPATAGTMRLPATGTSVNQTTAAYTVGKNMEARQETNNIGGGWKENGRQQLMSFRGNSRTNS